MSDKSPKPKNKGNENEGNETKATLHQSEWVNNRMLLTSYNEEALTFVDIVLFTGIIPEEIPDIRANKLIGIRIDHKPGVSFRSTLKDAINTAVALKKVLESETETNKTK